ncbi:MAG: SMC family ATPase [Chloroflexi bacterium]|nr:SMC family ATPase [Chloroflexota bacterium]
MIPKRLELNNFLAYRAPKPISFDGIDLACISGSNGVGKSSLLDAITWALWGKARARREDDLIHQGQREMQVSLDFEQDGIRYRVVRRRARTGRGRRGTLDLLIWGADESPRRINAEGIRRSQDKINQILRLDYETFVHSAFLQQGRADAFTLKTPAERKRILAEILGLDKWTVYEEAVKGQLGKTAQEISILEHDIRRADEEISRESQLREALEALTKLVDEAHVKLDSVSAQYDSLANTSALLLRERENRSQLERRMASRRVDMEAAEAEVKRQDDRIAEYHEIIAAADTIESGYQQLQAARENQNAIAESLSQQQALDAQVHKLETALAGQEAKLTRECEVLKARIEQLESQINAGETGDLDAIRIELAKLENLNSRRDESTKAIQALTARRSTLRDQLDQLRTEGQALNERLERLERVDAAEGAICPLCGQALTEDHRGETMAQLTHERDAKRQRYRDCLDQIRRVEDDSLAKQKEVDAWARQLKNLPALQQRKGALSKQIEAVRDAEQDLGILRNQLAQVEAQLEEASFGGELRRQLKQLEEQRSRITGPEASYADNRAQLETLAAYDRRQKHLEFAQINLPEAQELGDKTREQLEALEAAQSEDERHLEKNASEIKRLEAQVEQERELRGQLDQTRAEVQLLRERRTIAQQELKAVAAGHQTRTRLQGRLREALEEKSLREELRIAFGRDGVPGMIIETAIPELEAEANALLARMTDGGMRIGFNTQRETLAGAAVETLDITIADSLGARDYEMYSGGEAFRINFAIRIALSKLLARRAGAHLRTLFIDEGFGSQDAEGRTKLVDAINKIQADFDLILVITHIDELRDSFPARLLVEKTADGSTVTAS